MDNWFKKIQSLSERNRKIILWILMVVVALAILSYWSRGFSKKIQNMEGSRMIEELNIPSFEDVGGMPDLEMPENLENQLRELEEELEKVEEGDKESEEGIEENSKPQI